MVINNHEKEEKDKNFPPYIPFITLTAFVERLKNTATPAKIDHSVMSSLSGTVQSQLKSALRFLQLIDRDGVVADSFKSLVASYQTGQWKESLSEVISSAYAPILDGIDIKTATAAQLDDRFRTVGGVDGSTLDKSARFLLAALKEADTPFSPHWLNRATKKTRVKKTKKAGKILSDEGSEKNANPEQADIKNSPTLPPGTIRFPIPIPNKPMATIIVPEDLTDAEWSMIDGFFRSYIKIRHPSVS